MSDYIPSARQQRIEEFALLISRDLEQLQNRVDEGIILTDDFAFIVEKCFRGVAENYQTEKLESFRGILVNSAVGTKVVEDEKEYFINLVNSLSTLHIKILKFMAMPIVFLESEKIPIGSITGGFSEIFKVAIHNVDIEVIKSAFGDLYQYGFINTDKSIFVTMTSGQGIDLLGNRVSGLGSKFIQFCSVPTE